MSSRKFSHCSFFWKKKPHFSLFFCYFLYYSKLSVRRRFGLVWAGLILEKPMLFCIVCIHKLSMQYKISLRRQEKALLAAKFLTNCKKNDVCLKNVFIFFGIRFFPLLWRTVTIDCNMHIMNMSPSPPQKKPHTPNCPQPCLHWL